jgi:integrase/recombinase XerD
MTKDYNSIYGEHIQQFIAMKRKLGFKFVKDAKLLRSIDVLATESGQIAPGITKEFADLWIKKSLNESSRNHYQRAICLVWESCLIYPNYRRRPKLHSFRTFIPLWKSTHYLKRLIS